MKRWQDRGEVEDSEGDDDLSLDADSPSPERPYKRAKHTQDGTVDGTTLHLPASTSHAHISDDEDESNWIQAKVATTYGRQRKVTKNTPAPVSRRDAAGKDVEIASPKSILRLDDRETNRKDALKGPSTEPTPGGSTDVAETVREVSESAREDHSNATHMPDICQIISPAQTTAKRAIEPDDKISASSAAKRIVQPQLSASVLLRRPLQQSGVAARDPNGDDTAEQQAVVVGSALPETPARHSRDPAQPALSPPPNDDFMRLSDLLSSPLSERDVSPPLDFLPERSGVSAPLQDDVDASSEAESLPGGVSNPGNDSLVSAANARRSLRARQEKQLHPYMYDKAQYQKQFRERGLKPVRVVEQATPNEESQSASHSAVSQSSEVIDVSSPASQALRPTSTAHFQLDYFDKAGSSSEDELGAQQNLAKRRKVHHDDKRSGRLPSRYPVARPAGQSAIPNEYDIPLSPPRTSSDTGTPSAVAVGSRPVMSGFRLPLGRVHVPPPTPQISSEARPRNVDLDLSGCSPPTTSKIRGRRSHTLSPDLSSSDSEEEAQAKAEAEAKRLRREQKRIRGVLPASWLRIDFQRQGARHSPSPIRRLSLEPSPEKGPQKGLARKISTARTRQDTSPGLHALGSAESDDSDVSVRELTAVQKQSRLAFEGGRFSINSNEPPVDDEEMENDFVDPMLAGTSRPGNGKKRGPNQPRITDAFRKRSGAHGNFTDERAARHNEKRGAGISAPRKRKRQRHHHTRPTSTSTRLSIIDAPRSPSNNGNALPQFVRLALRRARREPKRGRHSPSDKLVRLATVDETAEASSVLRAWREGTIAPRRSQSPTRLDIPPPKASDHTAANGRVPLANLHTNGHQPRMQATGVRKSAASVAQPRLRPGNAAGQAQLQPMTPDQRPTIQENSHGTAEAGVLRRRQAMRIPPQNSRLRNGQLETLESEFDQMHRSAAFERRMHFLTENIALPEHRDRAPGFHITRFLHANDDHASNERGRDESAETGDHVLPHRPRKSLARRIDTGTYQYRQPSQPLPDLSIHDEEVLQVPVSISDPVLQGLGPFGTKYSVDFDIQPLALGTFFQHTTFIGSGELSDVLNLAKRDLSHAAGHMRVQLDGEMHDWGSWNEDVAANFMRIPRAIADALQTLDSLSTEYDREQQLSAVDSNIDYLLRSVVRFCSKCLYFVDTVDRRSCVESLYRLVADLGDTFAELVTQPLLKTLIKVLQYKIVITKQAAQLCDHQVVPLITKTQIGNLLSHTATGLAATLVGRFDDLRSAYEDTRQASKREAGVDGNALALSSVVLLNNVLAANGSRSLLWPAIHSTTGVDPAQTCSIGSFERLWYDLFSLLPALEFTAAGTACVGSRLLRAQEYWSLPQAMLSRVLELYERSSDIRGYSVNDYVRALLFRCYTLVNKWGWWRCESVLNIIYDFFSRRGFALLKKEESRGSPKFLDELGSGHVALELQNDDRSFHVFLKTLATGLLGMSKHRLYGDRKIQGIAWRFIPNHNRTYRKDVDVEWSTLDALRNHHDLLCTLYYASPPGHRPGVHLLRELVDHSTSHREACRLNVRSWANIASFQASTTESLEALRPLTSWFADVVKTTIAQYRLAKSEAQQAFDQAKMEGANPSEALLESAVTKNQRQIAATVIDALAGLKRALSSANSLATGAFLVEETSFWTVFELFDPSQRRLIGAMTEALQVVEIALDVQQRPTLTPESQHESDDSQDFGDSDALQEFAASDTISSERTLIVRVLLGPVGQFISNILGADIAPDDQLLQKAVDVWVHLAGISVKSAQKTWLSYVDEYSTTGWGQMRDTAQKRKFTTYFMSRVVEQSTLDAETSQHVVTAWLLSLVEREALLKFQHVLTSALLNHFGHHRLLQNLPFAKDSKGVFNVTLNELRQRRLALISCVLCNMREDHERAKDERSSTADEIQMTHEKMLRQLMQAMKSNYQELQAYNADAVADANVQGAYVDFVQQVVSFLQQHTTEICKVDGFFTDSTAFPLPADDPTYVVGRLKGYVPKLREPKHRKYLAVVVQSVSERAAIDGQQPYLVSQMFTAMRGVFERGDRTSPSLRHLLLTTMFPAYIENAFATACSWILVSPILQVCKQVIPDLLYSVKIEDESSVIAGTESAIAVLHAINQQIQKVLGNFPGMLDSAHVARTLGAMLCVGKSCLTFASFVKRATSHGNELMKHLRALRELAFGIKGRLQGKAEADMFGASAVANPPVCPWPDTKIHVETHLRDHVNPFWHAEDGKYYSRRTNPVREIVVSLQGGGEERTRLLQAIEGFCGSFEAVFNRRVRRGRINESGDAWVANVIV